MHNTWTWSTVVLTASAIVQTEPSFTGPGTCTGGAVVVVVVEVDEVDDGDVVDVVVVVGWWTVATAGRPGEPHAAISSTAPPAAAHHPARERRVAKRLSGSRSTVRSSAS